MTLILRFDTKERTFQQVRAGADCPGATSKMLQILSQKNPEVLKRLDLRIFRRFPRRKPIICMLGSSQKHLHDSKDCIIANIVTIIKRSVTKTMFDFDRLWRSLSIFYLMRCSVFNQ